MNSDARITVLGNYSPSRYDASRIVDGNGIAPTVKENHGTVMVVLVKGAQMYTDKVVCETRKDEGIRFFKDDICGALRTIDACGDKRVIEADEIINKGGGKK